MVLVDAGTFTMGNNNEMIFQKPAHQVTISSFLISTFEVTYDEYDLFCESTGRSKPYDWKYGRGKKPVTGIEWYDAIEYCNWLSLQEGLTPCYKIDKTKSDKKNKNRFDKKKWMIICDFTSSGYRLPTDSEWEYAARGGKLSKGFVCAGSNGCDEVSWYFGNSKSAMHDVGLKKPNELGLYDMNGNAWEFCWDWFEEYKVDSAVDPKGPSGGTGKVIRGGEFRTAITDLTVFIRGNSETVGIGYNGIRLVKSVKK